MTFRDAAVAQVHLRSLDKQRSFARRNSRNMCIRNCKCMLLRSVQAALRIFRILFSDLAPFLSPFQLKEFPKTIACQEEHAQHR